MPLKARGGKLLRNKNHKLAKTCGVNCCGGQAEPGCTAMASLVMNFSGHGTGTLTSYVVPPSVPNPAFRATVHGSFSGDVCLFLTRNSSLEPDGWVGWFPQSSGVWVEVEVYNHMTAEWGPWGDFSYVRIEVRPRGNETEGYWYEIEVYAGNLAGSMSLSLFTASTEPVETPPWCVDAVGTEILVNNDNDGTATPHPTNDFKFSGGSASIKTTCCLRCCSPVVIHSNCCPQIVVNLTGVAAMPPFVQLDLITSGAAIPKYYGTGTYGGHTWEAYMEAAIHPITLRVIRWQFRIQGGPFLNPYSLTVQALVGEEGCCPDSIPPERWQRVLHSFNYLGWDDPGNRSDYEAELVSVTCNYPCPDIEECCELYYATFDPTTTAAVGGWFYKNEDNSGWTNAVTGGTIECLEGQGLWEYAEPGFLFHAPVSAEDCPPLTGWTATEHPEGDEPVLSLMCLQPCPSTDECNLCPSSVLSQTIGTNRFANKTYTLTRTGCTYNGFSPGSPSVRKQLNIECRDGFWWGWYRDINSSAIGTTPETYANAILIRAPVMGGPCLPCGLHWTIIQNDTTDGGTFTQGGMGGC